MSYTKAIMLKLIPLACVGFTAGILIAIPIIRNFNITSLLIQALILIPTVVICLAPFIYNELEHGNLKRLVDGETPELVPTKADDN